MFIKEIICEDSVVGQLGGDLNDLLISARANDIDSVETSKVVAQLQDMGHSVSDASIINFLEGNPLVQTVTMDTISFKNTMPHSASGDEESKVKNQEKVK